MKERARKELFVDRLLKMDLMRDRMIAEIKKSSKHKKAARLQLAFYLYYLKREKGLSLKGVLLFPRERRSENVELTPELENEIESILQEMISVLQGSVPPPREKNRYCRSCSFQEICWG